MKIHFDSRDWGWLGIMAIGIIYWFIFFHESMNTIYQIKAPFNFIVCIIFSALPMFFVYVIIQINKEYGADLEKAHELWVKDMELS